MEGKTRVTIELLDLPESKPLVLEFPNANIIQERGYNIGYDHEKWVPGVVPNGQERARIDLWKGCPSYEAFKKEGS